MKCQSWFCIINYTNVNMDKDKYHCQNQWNNMRNICTLITNQVIRIKLEMRIDSKNNIQICKKKKKKIYFVVECDDLDLL